MQKRKAVGSQSDPAIVPELSGLDAIVDAEPPPPPYSETWSSVMGETPDVNDGRVNVDLSSKFAEAFGRLIPAPVEEDPISVVEDTGSDPAVIQWDLPLNIVIQVVGSRGDVQPFVALGCELRKHGHRVRLATHGVFEQFVHQAKLEFFPIGGDPTQLMAYMVKNPGLIPGMKTLREGEIQRKRAMMAEMLDGCWKSCVEPDPKTYRPFVAQAIIANPVSFAHIHCAQALSIPVHLMFTMPWTSTRAFPHPLANIKSAGQEPRLANYLSDAMVEWMTWQGIGGVVNKFRKSIDLEPVPTSEGPFLASTLRISHTYCWSTALVPRPKDWPSHIDVCGFFFRETPAYTPPPELAAFLSSGPPPIYIGFGSIVIDDPASLTSIILEAVEMSGVRAIISRGWSNIGDSSARKDIFYLDDCPHEWLFQKVSAVVHHGGAGTTACGLLNARPTVIVPFFGDQPFWGQMIANAKAGPQPIPHKALNSHNLAEAITFCESEETVNVASEIAYKMRDESGVRQAVASFLRQLPRDRLGCELVPGQSANWIYTNCKRPIRISNLAVENLCLSKDVKFKRKHLKHYGPTPILITNKRWDPFTSAGSSGMRVATDLTSSFVGIVADPVKVYLDNNKPGSADKSQLKLHGQAALASARNIDHLAVGAFKGGVVDIPLALAEGFRNAPKLWGQSVKDHGEITGWQSGVAVAGKILAYGFYDGLGGLFYKPYIGARNEGALGFAKGFGKGFSGFIVEPVSGTMGILGYTGDGISKSINRTINFKTLKHVLAAKRNEGRLLVREEQITSARKDVVEAFERRRAMKAEVL